MCQVLDVDEEEARSTFSCASLCGSKRNMTIAVIILLAVVAIVVGSVIATTSSRSQVDSDNVSSPTTGNTMPPPMALVELLSAASFDNGTALQTPSTPQNEALNWLANNTNLDTYSDKKKIQRYILAVLYFETNGKYWIQNDRWLSNEDECDWFNFADGSFCDETGAVTELDFYDRSTDPEAGNGLVGTIPNELAFLSDSLGKNVFGIHYCTI